MTRSSVIIWNMGEGKIEIMNSTNKPFFSFVCVFAMLIVSGCNATNEGLGAVSGAVLGGVVGNQFGKGSGRVAATVVGALAGGVIGGNIGRGLDQTSRNRAAQAEYTALEAGQSGTPVRWEGTNGTYGDVVPQQAYQVGSSNCRRYSHTIYIDDAPRKASGTACRNADGTWTPLT